MYNQFQTKLPAGRHTKKLIAPIKKTAEELINTTADCLPYSKFRLFHETGSRTEYEALYIEHRKRLNVFAVMSLYETDGKWVSALEDTVWAVLDEFSWSFPAHIAKDKTPKEAAENLDLFSTETAFALSEILYLLGDRIAPFVRTRAVSEIQRRVIAPYVKTDITWPKNNWSAVCAGSIACAVIYLGLSDVWNNIENRVLASLQTFEDSYENDGGCLEGPLYWQYGFGFFVYSAELICEYTNGRLNLLSGEKVRRMAEFAQKAHITADYVLPFADAPHNLRFDIGLLHYLKKKFSSVTVPDAKYEAVFGDDIRHHFCALIRNFFWYDEKLETEGTYDRSCYFLEDSGWYINKKHRLYFAAKGGSNAEPHNHCDLGSFVLFSGGNFILDDLGWPEYYNGYFGEKRENDLCASSRGHSVPMIDGKPQPAGEAYSAKVLSHTEAGFRLELSKAYSAPGLNSFQRSFTISDAALIVTDTLSGEINDFTERFVTRIEPKMLGGGVVKIADFTIVCGAKAEVYVSKEVFTPRLSICKMDMKPEETAYLIDFRLGRQTPGSSVTFIIEKSAGSF